MTRRVGGRGAFAVWHSAASPVEHGPFQEPLAAGRVHPHAKHRTGCGTSTSTRREAHLGGAEAEHPHALRRDRLGRCLPLADCEILFADDTDVHHPRRARPPPHRLGRPDAALHHQRRKLRAACRASVRDDQTHPACRRPARQDCRSTDARQGSASKQERRRAARHA